MLLLARLLFLLWLFLLRGLFCRPGLVLDAGALFPLLCLTLLLFLLVLLHLGLPIFGLGLFCGSGRGLLPGCCRCRAFNYRILARTAAFFLFRCRLFLIICGSLSRGGGWCLLLCGSGGSFFLACALGRVFLADYRLFIEDGVYQRFTVQALRFVDFQFLSDFNQTILIQFVQFFFLMHLSIRGTVFAKAIGARF